MERWQNKVAVVTDASAGIGTACVKDLQAAGMIVVGLARRQERIENELKAGLPKQQQSRFYAIKCDVSKEEDIVKTFAWITQSLGGVDVLVNNAGVVRIGTNIVDENNSADLRAAIDINVMGVAYCTREAFQSMKKRGVDGHVININSIVGHQVPPAGSGSLNMYPPSKYAITAMTEVLRQEFMVAGTKIKVTSISPGVVDTEILADIRQMLPENMPMLKPEAISSAVVYCIQTPPNVQIHEMIIKPVGEQ